jgi:hypothetical protein
VLYLKRSKPLAAAAGCAIFVALIGGCQPMNEGAPAAGGPGSSASRISPGLVWGSAVSGSGVALTLSNPDGSTLLQFACVRDPAVLTVEVDRFRQVASEERFSVGFGKPGDPVVFVADLSEARPQGVEARAPITPELLAKIESATELGASYGAQTLGPHIPPDQESAGRFTRACRQIAAR